MPLSSIQKTFSGCSRRTATRLEWVVDAEFCFFPVMRDDTFGYVLHPVDLAINKVTIPPRSQMPKKF